jgi:hypothetical protein
METSLPPVRDWIDVATVVTNAAGPIVAAVFGYWILRVTKRLEHAQWRNQKLVEKRIEVWDELGPVVNDIYCYCLRVGSWKELKPPDAVAKKRVADKLMHLNPPYFSASFFASYQRFINTCFEAFQGHGENAKIRSTAWEHKNVHPSWDESWDRCFLEVPLDDEELGAVYRKLIAQVSRELSPEK